MRLGTDYYDDWGWSDSSWSSDREEKPLFAEGWLESLSDDRLIQEMNRAYNHQAYVVDNGGSDDQSYRAERKCELIDKEVKRRNLEVEL